MNRPANNSTSVKVVEGRKQGTATPAYGLAISATIDDRHPIDKEIRHVNEAMINWLRERRDEAYGVKLFFVAKKDQQDDILPWVEKLLTQDVDVRAYLLRLSELELYLIDPNTGEEREFNLTLT